MTRSETKHTITPYMSHEDEDIGGEGSTGVLVESDVKVAKPKMYKVLLHNDDYTPMDFVVDILESLFKKTHSEATDIMLNVHNKGVGVCGIYPFAVAETKIACVEDAARAEEYPLKCTMEPV